MSLSNVYWSIFWNALRNGAEERVRDIVGQTEETIETFETALETHKKLLERHGEPWEELVEAQEKRLADFRNVRELMKKKGY